MYLADKVRACQFSNALRKWRSIYWSHVFTGICITLVQSIHIFLFLCRNSLSIEEVAKKYKKCIEQTRDVHASFRIREENEDLYVEPMFPLAYARPCSVQYIFFIFMQKFPFSWGSCKKNKKNVLNGQGSCMPVSEYVKKMKIYM